MHARVPHRIDRVLEHDSRLLLGAVGRHAVHVDFDVRVCGVLAGYNVLAGDNLTENWDDFLLEDNEKFKVGKYRQIEMDSANSGILFGARIKLHKQRVCNIT